MLQQRVPEWRRIAGARPVALAAVALCNFGGER
jgi:hypothetical protein